MKIEKMIVCGLFIILMICIMPVSANPILSVKTITNPEPVAPGETFSFNILVNHYNDEGFVADHSYTTIQYDPTYITMDNNPSEWLSSPIGPGGTCDLGPNGITCGGGTWGFQDVVDKFMFSKPLTGNIKDSTPIGTKIKIHSCIWAIYSTVAPTFSIEACDEDHFITVGNPISSPEFPSGLLPITMIIGILSAVLLIQRTRKY